MIDPDKRRYRQLKRDIKKAGNRARRRHLKRELTEGPEEAAQSDSHRGASRPLACSRSRAAAAARSFSHRRASFGAALTASSTSLTARP